MFLTSKVIKFIPKSIRNYTVNYFRFVMLGLVIMLGWNTLAAGMRVVKALDHRVASQLEFLAD